MRVEVCVCICITGEIASVRASIGQTLARTSFHDNRIRRQTEFLKNFIQRATRPVQIDRFQRDHGQQISVLAC